MATVLITGANKGIGLELVKIYAEQGDMVVACCRNPGGAEALNQFAENNGVDVQQVQVGDGDSVASLVTQLGDKPVDILINNAGNAHGLDKIQDGNIEDWDKMIDGNVKGLLYVTKAVIGRMVEKSSGHIINIGSLAGREVYQKGNVYCASKSAVNAISKGMRIDLNKHNIKVSEINPGLVETEFSKVRFKGDSIADTIYKGYKALQAEDIAEIIEFIISRPHHVNIADILVLPQDQASSSIINKK